MIRGRNNRDIILALFWGHCVSFCEFEVSPVLCTEHLHGWERIPGKLMNSQPGDPLPGAKRLSMSLNCSIRQGSVVDGCM